MTPRIRLELPRSLPARPLNVQLPTVIERTLFDISSN